MSKILVFAVALAIVLGSGAFFNAQADCGFQLPIKLVARGAGHFRRTYILQQHG